MIKFICEKLLRKLSKIVQKHAFIFKKYKNLNLYSNLTYDDVERERDRERERERERDVKCIFCRH